MVTLENIPGSEMEKRALEVALVGGHSLAILHNVGSHAPQLIRTAMRLAQEIPVPFRGLAYPWCPCGNYGSPKAECRCSAKTIERHLSKLGKWMDRFAIWLGGTVPLARHLHIKGESEAAVMKRVKAARAALEPSVILDASCQEMIRYYLGSVSSSLDIAKVKAIAASIARLDGQARLLVQHMAEALQYQPCALPGFRMWVTAAPGLTVAETEKLMHATGGT